MRAKLKSERKNGKGKRLIARPPKNICLGLTGLEYRMSIFSDPTSLRVFAKPPMMGMNKLRSDIN
jgi:hypothetical protein